MKYPILALSLVLVATAQMAHASDGAINFAGHLVNTTCTVSVNGSSNDATVTLPTLSALMLSNTVNAGTTFFDIQLSGCTEGLPQLIPTSTRVLWVGTRAYKSFLLNTGIATNVLLTLRGAIDYVISHILVGDGSQATTQSGLANCVYGVATMRYSVSYWKVGIPTPGTVKDSVTDTIMNL